MKKFKLFQIGLDVESKFKRESRMNRFDDVRGCKVVEGM